MTENRKIALETAHTFGHKDHRELLKTAMDIETYLEKGSRPALKNEMKCIKIEMTNEAIHSLFNSYHFNLADDLVGHIQKFKKVVKVSEQEELVLTTKSETDTDGNTDIIINAELKPLTNSKKK